MCEAKVILELRVCVMKAFGRRVCEVWCVGDAIDELIFQTRSRFVLSNVASNAFICIVIFASCDVVWYPDLKVKAGCVSYIRQ